MNRNADGVFWEENRENLPPVKVVASGGVEDVHFLTDIKPGCVLYRRPDLCSLWRAGSWVILDFGKEIHGGARVTVCRAKQPGRFRFTFGESLSEAASAIGEQNATNDHSPRDFEVTLSKHSDNVYGETGFRFLKVELLSDVEMRIQSIYAQSILPVFQREGEFVTDDPLLNQIVETCVYTLKLCFQKGYVWDGIKRDRLVWCGDLHPELLTSLYLFGDTAQVRNSLTVLRAYNDEEWVNNIPSYSAWWVINLCDLCGMTENVEFWEENCGFARRILHQMALSCKPDGTVFFEGERPLNYFLDWSTKESPESAVGVASLFLLAAKKYLAIEENEDCRSIIQCLSPCLGFTSETKPVRAFQILAGREEGGDSLLLQKDGAKGFSTFMAYYILSAMARSGGEDMLPIVKSYYGGMLSRGATTFWEDFDISWLEGSGRIDAFPLPGEKDIHGSFGNHCYLGFRHSLCHGWSTGVLSFLIEYFLGLKIEEKGKKVTVAPQSHGLGSIHARLPLSGGWLTADFEKGKWSVSAPEEICLILLNQ